MKIAAVTDDEVNISAHFGRAPYYLVVTVEGDQIIGREKRAKAFHAPDEAHHHTDAAAHHQHGAMIDPIRDCDIVLARGMGTPAYNSLQAAGLHPIITDVRSIDSAVQAVINHQLVDHPERLH